MSRALLLLISGLLLIAADRQEDRDGQRKPAQINIIFAESMEAPYDGIASDIIRLIGNVRLSHEDVYMFCDSAHRHAGTNTVHAFGNVHINQGDTLQLYGDHLIYYGNRRYAEVRRNVKLMDTETTLTTEYLDFDLQNDFGYYPNRAVVINGENRLESIHGYYYTNEKLFFFRDSVVITNPDYIIRSDTLRYNTLTEVVYFLGPTTITGNETDIYCENGWYDTQSDISQFNENARVRNNNQVLEADSIYFDNGNGTGKAYINIVVTDSVENIIISGDYAWFIREPEQMLVTDRALLIQMSDNDTLYLHADTLRSWLQLNQAGHTDSAAEPDKVALTGAPETGGAVASPDTIPEITGVNEADSAGTAESVITQAPVLQEDTIRQELPFLQEDTTRQELPFLQEDTTRQDIPSQEQLSADEGINDTVRIMVAYYGVRFFSDEMQGKCDSLYYNMRDSVIYMYGKPVVWSDESQLSSEYMEIHTRGGQADRIIMNNSSYIISEEDQGLYNQIKGKDIFGFFRDGELYRVNVSGNAETLYYPVDNEEIIGINKAASANLVIFLKENKPDRIRFLNRPEAVLYPMDEVPAEEMILKDFQWLDHLRPKFREDVFRK